MRRFPLQIGGVGGGPAARSAAVTLSNRLRYPFGQVLHTRLYGLLPLTRKRRLRFVASYRA